MRLPTFSSYGKYSSDNYGVNTLVFTLSGVVKLYFSYQTIVAFWTPEDGTVVTHNDWSTTTGKHLNWIDGGDKKARLPRQEFEDQLTQAMKRWGFAKSFE